MESSREPFMAPSGKESIDNIRKSRVAGGGSIFGLLWVQVECYEREMQQSME